MENLIDVNFEILTLLLNTKNLNNTLFEIFGLVAKHTNVDRVYYFEVYQNIYDKKYYTSQKIEWAKDDIEPMINNPDLQNIPFEEVELFVKPLLSNKPFEAIVSKLPNSQTKAILESQNILSILVLPLYVENKITGFIGFDDCSKERLWGQNELKFLTTITINLSTAIYKNNAELKMKLAIQEKRDILESFDEGFFSLNDKLEVVYWNKQSEKLFGINANDAIGKKILDLKVCHVFANRLKSRIKNNLPFESFSYIRNFKAWDVWFQVNFYYHGSNSSILIKNITNIKKTNVKLKKSYNKIANKNKTLQEIASMQSHELRAPLSRILGIINAIEDTNDSDNQKYLFNGLLKSAKELDTVVKKITIKTYQ
jgi:PAS domain S-box-containing protein